MTRATGWLVATLAACTFASHCVARDMPQSSEGPALTELARGVYALVRPEPLGLANHANDAFIIGRRGVMVIDTAFTLDATREAMARLHAQSALPVLYVVNTHWHDDHIFGDQVYRDAYPDVQFVAQSQTRDDMAGQAVANRARQVEGGPAAVAAIQRALDEGRSLDGHPLSAAERRAYASTVMLARQFLDDASHAFRAVVPDIVVDSRAVLDLGGRQVELLHVGPAVTAGDLVAWLPRERILVAGDVVNAPFPFAYGCDLEGWIRALKRVLALEPRIIVPGHGPVLRGTQHVETLLKFLASVRRLVGASVASGASAEATRQRIDLGDFRRTLAGDDPMLGFLFDRYFAAPAINAALKARGIAGA